MEHSYVPSSYRLSESGVAKSKQGCVNPKPINYQDLGKLALKDEIRNLRDNHPDPVIRLLATFALKTDT